VINGPFSYVLTVGMVAAVNPCGFAMLPAYLSYFLGTDGTAGADGAGTGSSARASTVRRLVRAVAVSLAVSLGFLTVFAVIGAIVNAGAQQVVEWAKYASIVIGLALVALGGALLAGWHLPFATPRLDRGGKDRTVVSMYVFGVSYAVASIGCTLPTFLTVVIGSFTRTSFVSGLALTATYGAGMALVLTALTVTLALAEDGLLRVLRVAMRYVDRVAGAFLVVAGIYLVYYWTYSLRFDRTGSLSGGGMATTVEGWSATASQWLDDHGRVVLPLVLVAVALATALIVVVRSGTRPAAGAPADAPAPVLASGPERDG
jgi:cytochrome c-type biogenesis protein